GRNSDGGRSNEPASIHCWARQRGGMATDGARAASFSWRVRMSESLESILLSCRHLQAGRRAAYYLAETCELRCASDRMVAMLDLCGVAPGRDEDTYQFESHLDWSRQFEEVQRVAIGRGIPAIYMNMLPNSGSSFLSGFITTILNIERCRT